MLPSRSAKHGAEGILNNLQTSPDSIKDALQSEQKAEIKEKAFYSAGCIYELTKWLIVGVITLFLVHFFIATLIIVDGLSMEPNFHTNEIIAVNRWQYLFGTPERGDASVIKFPGDPEHKKYIKRIIGIPGDTVAIANGAVYINGKKLSEPYLAAGTVTSPNLNRVLKTNEYFLMGDNRANSSDSRVWGVADKRFLIGKAWLAVWPKGEMGLVKHL